MLSISVALQDCSPRSSIGPRAILQDCPVSLRPCAGESYCGNLPGRNVLASGKSGKIEQKSIKMSLFEEHGYAYPKTNLEGLPLWL